MMQNVLLVEDNEANQLVIQDIFDFDNVPASLTCVECGEVAIEQAEKLMPDLILMDIHLPGMDGLETARQLKNNSLTSEIPIWALTANAMKDDAAKGISAGCCDYITKPIDIKSLAEKLRNFLETINQEEVEVKNV